MLCSTRLELVEPDTIGSLGNNTKKWKGMNGSLIKSTQANGTEMSFCWNSHTITETNLFEAGRTVAPLFINFDRLIIEPSEAQ